MDIFAMRPEVQALLDRVKAMIHDEVIPLEEAYAPEIDKGDRWSYTARQYDV